MEKIFLETERLYLKYITQNDFQNLSSILKDSEVMYAWEYEFSDEDVQLWIDKCTNLYETHNSGYFLAVDKVSKAVIGQAALMPDNINNKQYYEIGYILKKQYWNKGYATECAKALAEYAFTKLNLKEVIFEIRPCNTPSRKVAEKLGACIEDNFIKHVHGKDFEHLIYKLYSSIN